MSEIPAEPSGPIDNSVRDLEPPRNPVGCFLPGCVICLVLVLAVALVGFLAIRTVAKRLNAFIAEYTESQPMNLPQVEIGPDELKSLQERWKKFSDDGTNTATITLTAREINALLATDPGTRQMKDWFYVIVDGDTVRGQVSMPMESQFKVPFLRFKGRYLNGSAVFSVTMSNQMLRVTIQSLEVKGRPVPGKFMEQLEGVDFAGDYYAGSNSSPRLRIESVAVTNGTIVIKRAAK